MTLCVSLSAAAATAADWPCYLGANRDNTSADTKLKLWSGDHPKVLWKKNVGTGHSCMAVVGKQLFTQGNGAVWCLDADTGDVVWRYPPPKGQRRRDHGYASRCRWIGLCAEQRSYDRFSRRGQGELQWSVNVDKFGVKQGGWALSCSPLVLGNRVIMDLGVVFILDKKTGKLVWKAGSETAGYASAVFFRHAGNKLVTSFNGDGLAIYSPSQGKLVAKYKWETAYGVNAATPIVSDGKIFISSGYGRGCSLLSLEGNALEKVWENKEMNNHCQTCVLAGGFLYGVHGQQGQKGQPQVPGLRDGQGQVGPEGPARGWRPDAGRRQALRHAGRRHAVGGRGIAQGLHGAGPRQGPGRPVLDDAGRGQRPRVLPQSCRRVGVRGFEE